MIDIDHFKDLNDEHGHLSGDDVLRTVSGEIGAHARRAGDVVARFGGEEFVMLLPHTDGPTAAALAESLRAAVASMETTSHKGARLRVTISIGVSTAAGDLSQQSPEVLVEQADLALYSAKRAGRNRVATHTRAMPLTEIL
jgi:diguanylate cyclase (GGDEF)-like protein